MSTQDFKEKVLSLSDRLYPMVARMTSNSQNAEDAVQEIMIKLWDRRDKLTNHPNITAYVFLTAKNYCLDMLKKSYPLMDSSEIQLSKISSNGESNPLELSELTTLIKEILQELPDQQRDIMIMRDIDGLEFQEIAAITKLKIEHVRVLVSRARKHVGSKLKDIYSYE